MSNRDEITREALALSPEDRAYVADALERSLETGSFATPELADAWSAEIHRRIAAFERGETTPVDLETSNARLREAFRQRRDGVRRP